MTRADADKDWLLAALVGAMLLVRIVYVLSYPFLIEGDGEAYYQLMLESQAHLLHATGYVFFSLPVCLLAKLAGTEPANLLLYSQQAVSVVSITALYLALRRLVPRWIGFLTCLPLGIDTQMVAAAGTTRPEFLQAVILMLLASSAIFGLTAAGERTKTVFYSGLGVLLVAGYLTKYNFLPALVFCLVPLFDSGLPWKFRWRMLARSGLGGTVLLVLFLTAFHHPTTGSWRLHLARGWIHLPKLNAARIPLLPTNGIATKKLIVLAESLPVVPAAGPGPWRRMDQVPDAVRAASRQRWSALLATRDETAVDGALDALPAPDLQRTNYHDPAAFSLIYYHLGLEEGEELAGAAFREGVRGHSRQYVSGVWRELVHSAQFSAHYEPYLPVPAVHEPGGFFEFPGMRFPAAPRVFKAVDWSVAQPGDLAALAAQVWFPGARLFSFLAFLRYIPAGLLWIVMLAGGSLAAVSLARQRRLRPAETLLLLSAVALLGALSFSAALYFFRNKELILCQPLIYLVLGLAVAPCVALASPSRSRRPHQRSA